jgi:UDP-GlcNAc:undecaprenyl-phosphate GlcNAc-1-phosphate transferase
MITATLAFLLAACVSAALTPAVRFVARRKGFFDSATERKVHSGRIPRLGGVAIVLAFFTPVAGIYFIHSQLAERILSGGQDLRPILFGGFAVALLGIYDDFRGADAKVKFAVQFAVAGYLYHQGFRVEHIATGSDTTMSLGWLSGPVTVLWIVGITNAVNLIDGLDGLAGGVALIALVAIFSISSMRSEALMMLFSASLGGAVLGFLFYNFNPATIFMGDTGSMFLGVMLATSALKAGQKTSTTIAITVPLLLLALPICDTALAIIRRGLKRRSLFTADSDHIHHRLIRLGLSQRQAVGLLYAVCGAASLASIAAYLTHVTATLLSAIAAALVIAFAIVYKNVSSSRRNTAFESHDTRVPTITPLFSAHAQLQDATGGGSRDATLVDEASDLPIERSRIASHRS